MTVPRRAFPKAYRNAIFYEDAFGKLYRLNKNWLYERLPENAPQYGLMVIYIAKEELPFKDIEKATQKWMKIFCKKLTVHKKPYNQLLMF